MNRLLSLLFGLCFFYQACAQEITEINFEPGLTWVQIKQKAKSENKYIFLDCFTTWCAPCKKMDKEVYTTPEVASYINNHFISVKVQLDTNKADNADVRDWYQQSAAIAHNYNVQAYPTFIFLSPLGEIVHKGIGFKDKVRFLTLLNQATDSNKQFYTLLKEYRKGVLNYGEMPYLIAGLQAIGERDESTKVRETYINNYILKLNEDSLYTKKNIRFLALNIQNTKSGAFKWFYLHANRIDSVSGKGYSTKLICQLISYEEVRPALLKWDSLKIEKVSPREWAKLKGGIENKYNKEFADRTVLDGQLHWYSEKKSWQEVVGLTLKKIDKYGLDTTGEVSIALTNNIMYDVIFMHSNDSVALKKAIGWIKAICELKPGDADYLDTYANLLYKRGDVENALILENKAFSINSKSKDIAENIEKMKQGKPTWSVN